LTLLNHCNHFSSSSVNRFWIWNGSILNRNVFCLANSTQMTSGWKGDALFPQPCFSWRMNVNSVT
jgi:hypothetical protein